MVHKPLSVDTQMLFQALETAKAAALEAGDYLQQKQGQAEVISKKALRDTLLDVDLVVEEIIINKLRQDFPDHEILSEETVGEKKDSVYRWPVDPLDGSTNFQHGYSAFATSISLLINDVTTVGVVYLPLQKEMFTAIKGHGARLNDELIHVSYVASLNDSIIHVGDFAKDGNKKENKELLKDIGRLANAVGRIRMIGTAATDLAYVACGRADALVIHRAQLWDIEVACLFVREAGGKVALQKSESGRPILVCSNEYIYQQILEILPKNGDRNSHFTRTYQGKRS